MNPATIILQLTMTNSARKLSFSSTRNSMSDAPMTLNCLLKQGQIERARHHGQSLSNIRNEMRRLLDDIGGPPGTIEEVLAQSDLCFDFHSPVARQE